MKINKIVKNKYLNALFYLMIFSSAVHVIILIIDSLLNLSIEKLDFFSILQVYLLFPVIKNNIYFNISGLILMIGVYLFFLLKYKE